MVFAKLIRETITESGKEFEIVMNEKDYDDYIKELHQWIQESGEKDLKVEDLKKVIKKIYLTKEELT